MSNYFQIRHLTFVKNLFAWIPYHLGNLSVVFFFTFFFLSFFSILLPWHQSQSAYIWNVRYNFIKWLSRIITVMSFEFNQVVKQFLIDRWQQHMPDIKQPQKLTFNMLGSMWAKSKMHFWYKVTSDCNYQNFLKVYNLWNTKKYETCAKLHRFHFFFQRDCNITIQLSHAD